MNRLIQGDVLEVLPTLGRFKLLISDPPDNIGLGYDGYDDKKTNDDYLDWFGDCLREFLHHAQIVWVSFNAKYLLDIGGMVSAIDRMTDFEPRLFMQTFTFGQNRESDCGNGYRPLLRLKHRDATLYPEAIRVPSWRQLNGDTRAADGGRVPLDVWDFPRVVGNSAQRRSWHPTQLNEGLIERIIKFSTVPGDAICDCFSGTGTVLRAVENLTMAPKSCRRWGPVTSIELSRNYCLHIAAEHGLKIEQLEKAA